MYLNRKTIPLAVFTFVTCAVVAVVSYHCKNDEKKIQIMGQMICK